MKLNGKMALILRYFTEFGSVRALLLHWASVANKHISAVKTYRSVDVFVTRLHPHTTAGELLNCVDEVKGDLQVNNTKCTKLKSRYEHLYASFYVSVRVDSSDLKTAIDKFLISHVMSRIRRRNGSPSTPWGKFGHYLPYHMVIQGVCSLCTVMSSSNKARHLQHSMIRKSNRGRYK